MVSGCLEYFDMMFVCTIVCGSNYDLKDTDTVNVMAAHVLLLLDQLDQNNLDKKIDLSF